MRGQYVFQQSLFHHSQAMREKPTPGEVINVVQVFVYLTQRKMKKYILSKLNDTKKEQIKSEIRELKENFILAMSHNNATFVMTV